MGMGVGVFLFTIGAIFTFAINADALEDSINLNAVGVILMAVGAFVFGLQWYLITRSSNQVPAKEPEDLFDEENPPKG